VTSSATSSWGRWYHMNLDDAPKGYDMFMRKQDDVMKIVLCA
jgi:hypothetical protein